MPKSFVSVHSEHVKLVHYIGRIFFYLTIWYFQVLYLHQKTPW